MSDDNRGNFSGSSDRGHDDSKFHDDPAASALFLELYGSLPRAAPGSDQCTRNALSLLPQGDRDTVLDIGCGPGAQTLSLARALPGSQVTAFDLLPLMAAEARRRCRDSGISHRVAVAVADMAQPPVADASQDLIWCEGAIYNLGILGALSRWRPLLRHRGVIAFSEPVWLRNEPAEEIRQWWSAEYPAFTDVAGVGEAIVASGYDLVASFVLPQESWWDDYYGPLERTISRFLEKHPRDESAAAVAVSAQTEIAMHRRFGDAYGYAFFIVQPAAGKRPLGSRSG